MKTIGLKNAVDSFEMHDPLGNTCAAALFKPGVTEFELYLWEFNSSVPKRITGDLGRCQGAMQRFFDRKIAEGFEQPLADQMGKAIRS